MAKQNVFNFKTMQFELVECDDLLTLIDDLNAECAAQQSRAVDLPYAPFQNICSHCNGIGGCSSSCPTQANH